MLTAFTAENPQENKHEMPMHKKNKTFGLVHTFSFAHVYLLHTNICRWAIIYRYGIYIYVFYPYCAVHLLCLSAVIRTEYRCVVCV